MEGISLQMDAWVMQAWRLVMIEERSQVSHGTLALGHAALRVFYGTTRTPLPFGRIEGLLPKIFKIFHRIESLDIDKK